MKKHNSKFKTVCNDNTGEVTDLKQQKLKRWYYLASQWHLGYVMLGNTTFLIFAVLVLWVHQCRPYTPF